MTNSTQQLDQSLKAHHHSLTAARRIVFEALRHNEPLTMNQIIEICHGQIDRTSVYRTVALFERLGISQRLQVGWKYRIELSDNFQPHHHHMYCLRCSMTVELPEDVALEARLLSLAKNYDFLPQDHQIEIRGVCTDCQKQHTNPQL